MLTLSHTPHGVPGLEFLQYSMSSAVHQHQDQHQATRLRRPAYVPSTLPCCRTSMIWMLRSTPVPLTPSPPTPLPPDFLPCCQRQGGRAFPRLWFRSPYQEGATPFPPPVCLPAHRSSCHPSPHRCGVSCQPKSNLSPVHTHPHILVPAVGGHDIPHADTRLNKDGDRVREIITTKSLYLFVRSVSFPARLVFFPPLLSVFPRLRPFSPLFSVVA